MGLASKLAKKAKESMKIKGGVRQGGKSKWLTAGTPENDKFVAAKKEFRNQVRAHVDEGRKLAQGPQTHVIKSANEAKVNQQGHVIIEGKGVNRADVPQHQEILRERLKYKSKKMEEHKSKPGYQEKQAQKRKKEESVRLNAPKPTTSEIKASKKQERKVNAIAKLKLQQDQGLRTGVEITPQKLDKDTGLQTSPSKIKSKGSLTKEGKKYYKNKNKKKSTGDPIPF